MGGKPLNAAIVGMTATRTGGGYWLVTAAGGIFSFGDAQYHGSLGGQKLTAPVIGITVSVNGNGYWISEANGAIRNFGDAEPLAQISKPLNQPLVATAPMH
jgi:hypothetical protein